MSSEVGRGSTTMNEAEVDGILTQLNDLKDELTEGRVGPECPRRSDSKLSNTICDIRGLITCIDLNCSPNDQGTDFRGIKLVTSTLKDIRAECHVDLEYEVVDNRNSIPMEENLSDEMTKCIEEAHAALKECKELRRCIQDSREKRAKQTKDASSQKYDTLDEKRMRKFVVTTKDIAFQLHYDVFGANFLEDNKMNQSMDTKCGENEHLRLLYLSGKIVKQCWAELGDIKCILKQILADCSVREDLETSVSIKAISNDIRDEVAELVNSAKKTNNEPFEVKRATDVQKTENELLLSTYEQTKADLDKLQAKYEKLQTENRDRASRQQQKESEELQTAKQTISSLNEDIKSSRTRYEQKDKEYGQIQNDLTKIQEDNKDLIKRLDGKEGELTARLKEINMLQNEKGDLLNRLSQYTSAQLTHDNPNVADLSDANRPTKIAEQFSELYDNQWTDAFGVIKDSYRHSEERTISALLFILTQAYEFCLSSSIAQDQHIKLALEGKGLSSTTVHENNSSSDLEVSSLEQKMIHGLKKRAIETSIKVVKEDFSKHLKKGSWTGVNLDEEDVNAYAQACAHICWHMVLHSPRLYIESNYGPEESFDTNKYKYYKTSGQSYKYIVWPVLYLHQEGPILLKGVAEAE